MFVAGFRTFEQKGLLVLRPLHHGADERQMSGMQTGGCLGTRCSCAILSSMARTTWSPNSGMMRVGVPSELVGCCTGRVAIDSIDALAAVAFEGRAQSFREKRAEKKKARGVAV